MAKKLLQTYVENDTVRPIIVERELETLATIDLDSLIDRVISRIAPAWDVRDYVAVNPLFGYRNEEFLEVIKRVHGLRGTLLLPEKNYFKEKYASGKIKDCDLTYALMLYQGQAQGSELCNVEFNQLIEFLDQEHIIQNSFGKVRCISDLHDQEFQSDETARITNEVSKWLAAYFDEGQSIWKLPKNSRGLFATWKNLVVLDDTRFKDDAHFRDLVESLPNDPHKALKRAFRIILKKFKLSEGQSENYFLRLIATISGWASFVKGIDFQREVNGNSTKDPTSLVDLLAMRLTYDLAYMHESISLGDLPGDDVAAEDFNANTLKNYLWLLADEISVRREISGKINFAGTDSSLKRPLAQIAFCIDVRSEVMRRQIEAASEEIETIGFAGFFGVPIAIKKLGFEASDHNCPVLLKPALEVSEDSEQPEKIIRMRRENFLKKYGNKASQQSSHSAFSLAETFGLTYAGKMLANALGFDKPNMNVDHIDERLGLNTRGIKLETKIQLAYGALFNMGLVKSFGKHIIFFGHGGESSNNPYQGALDCGACAGHNGRFNSQFLAKVLNEPEVRQGLADRDIQIPADTHFHSGWHNTTTDQLHIDNVESSSDIQTIMETLDLAARACRVERSQHLLSGEKSSQDLIEKEFRMRARDWSETRPEWALARNHSFIVGRRTLTRKVNLEGRSFLHDYDESTDPELKKLELIMTAPMIVTNWINMQYYASTIDPEKFGTGNKVLNNVVGTIGCVQGNGSDLLTGLSEQSVRFNGKYFHEPVRLQVFIEASTSSIDKIIEKHEMVSELVSNNWLNIIAIDTREKDFKLRLKNKWISIKEALWN